jgi:hypothetical protein
MFIYTINGYVFQFFISTIKGAILRHFFHPSILLKNSPAVTAALADNEICLVCQLFKNAGPDGSVNPEAL